MRPRQPLPRLWLMTDARQGESLWTALERLPRGSGVVFRHYQAADRRALYARVRRVARRRGLVLVTAGAERLPGADGVHNRRGAGLRTTSAHGLRELKRAERDGANLVFLSPVFATRSHPGRRTLGPMRFGLITRAARVPVVALGGMTVRRAHWLKGLGAYGWAAIDALSN